MAEIPIGMIFEDDEYPCMITVEEESTIAEIIEAVTNIANRRIEVHHDRPMEVIVNGEVYAEDEDKTLGEIAGPMDFVQVVYADSVLSEEFTTEHPAYKERSIIEEHPEHSWRKEPPHLD